MKNKLKIIFHKILGPIIEPLTRNIPGIVGIGLRYYYYKLVLNYIGKKVAIDTNVYIQSPINVSIDDNSWIDKNTILIAGAPDPKGRKILYKSYENSTVEIGKLVIGKNVHISPFVVVQAHGGCFIGDDSGIASGSKIYTLSNHYRNLIDKSDNHAYKYTPRAPKHKQFLICAPVIMERNTGVGLNSSVLPGSKICENAWLGVNSSLLGTLECNTIAMGSPAKVIKIKTNTELWPDEL
jgi:acetyltransferase-like isoleucine patch superfamily enzyme